MSLIALLIALIPLIALHELGHLIVAKRCGMDVDTFAVGFGPRRWSLGFRWRGTHYSLRPFLLGGFVSIPQMDSFERRRRRIPIAPAWQRLLVVLAGPVANVAIGAALIAAACVVEPDLLPQGRQPVEMALESTVEAATIVAALPVQMASGEVAADELAGPITVAQMAGEFWGYGLGFFLLFAGLLSLGLGLMNMLPIPGLDGSHALVAALEAGIRRPLPERIHRVLDVAGIVVVSAVTILVIVLEVL